MTPPARPPVRAVVFDLDGTLVQTRIASWEVFEKISRRYGLGVDDPEQYFALFNGNIYTSIAELCRDEQQAAEVKEEFLRLLRTEYTPPLVPGMAAVVRRLAASATLAVMSSNAMQVLRRVLVANDLAFCFAHVYGGDVIPDKRTAIRAFLAEPANGYGRRCSADYDEAGRPLTPDPASTVLVTDTAGDVRDALATGIRVVGVAWGMHTVEELTAAGAEFVALWPQELLAHLLGDAAADPVGGACALPAAPAAPTVEHESAPEPDPLAAVRAAAAARRRRRRTAARADVLVACAPAPPVPQPAQLAGAGPVAGGELLSAIRRTCGG
ncbi:phosphoglycolate phosphatase [Pseudonocardia thermophila]|uniref:Phosphoglycolate phosphatase n=1 Tax=Pseudonocardia thermophila TaxID=1848 RepID=A0A1M7A028_PSETH|nr:HAD family hydrolase [Pseudonocardia thermophila]SHL36138.1 phosphoglycolate phosphatase [Pseudonocardia thermophila]